MNLTREQEEMLLNPQPGTAAARAREFGIDLTLNIERLRRTPEERLLDLQNFVRDIEELRNQMRRNRRP
ncbi:MAG TPA: hypothetical protein VNQ79_10945 [Blastocatellia bacterium]|nr:hypothetical protein [Blastocatellia bacterium]